MALPLFPIRGRVVLIGIVGATAALTYTLTLSLMQQEKIDLRTVQPPEDLRVAPTATIIPNRWGSQEETDSTAAKKRDPVNPKRDQQADATTEDTENDTTSEATQEAALPAGCSIPPGGGPPVNAAFEPC